MWFDVTEDGSVELDSKTFDGHVSFSLKEETLVRQKNWGDYARGAKYALRKEFKLAIFFSGLTRSLVNSDYNLRVSECKTAAWNILLMMTFH